MSNDPVSKIIRDKNSYILEWLSVGPSYPQGPNGFEAGITMDKRLETILKALHKERDKNVLPFKQRKAR